MCRDTERAHSARALGKVEPKVEKGGVYNSEHEKAQISSSF